MTVTKIMAVVKETQRCQVVVYMQSHLFGRKRCSYITHSVNRDFKPSIWTLPQNVKAKVEMKARKGNWASFPQGGKTMMVKTNFIVSSSWRCWTMNGNILTKDEQHLKRSKLTMWYFDCMLVFICWKWKQYWKNFSDTRKTKLHKHNWPQLNKLPNEHHMDDWIVI